MNCEQVREWMPHYLEGSLPPEREQYLRLHIESCPGCTQSLEEARELAAIWNEMERNTGAPGEMHIPDIAASVMAEIQLLEEERRLRDIQRAPSRRRYAPRTSWMHYSVAACMTFILFQFGIFEGLAYQISEINVQMSSSVTSWFGAQSNP